MEINSKTLLKDISQATGYSIPTISRAIKNSGYVKLDKKRAIMTEALKCGYFKNLLSNIPLFSKITVLVPYKIITATHKGVSTFYLDIFEELKLEIQRLNMELDVSIFDDSTSVKTVVEKHVVQTTDAIIAIGFDSQNMLMLSKLISKPIMLINSQLYSTNFNSISPDNRAIAYQCTEYLIKNGHENILHLTDDNRKTILDRILGFKDALEEYQMEFHDYNVLNTIQYGDSQDENASQVDEVILNTLQKHNITAIFTAKDAIALHLLQLFNKNDISVPKDISIISIDNDNISKYSHPSLTTYQLPKKEIAIHAIQSLIYQQVLLNNTTIKTQLYGKLIERNSVKNISKNIQK